MADEANESQGPAKPRKQSPEAQLRKAEKSVEQINGKLVKAREKQTAANQAVTDLENELLDAQGVVQRIRSERVALLEAELARVRGEN